MGVLFKEKLARGELVRLFALGRFPSPVTVELFALAGGYDGCWLDQEHTGMTYEQILVAALAAKANGMDTFVRMAPTSYALVTQNLETGAGGVMAARIESAAQAEEFVQWAKFAPRGSRGLNSSGRDADYSFKPAAQFAADANRDHLVAIQIETLGALREADPIAAIDGVDVLFIGPADLSQALGILGQFDNPKLWEGYAAVDAACKKHGKHWGTIGPSPEFIQRAMDHGCSMMTFGSELHCLRKGIEATKQANAKWF